MDNQKPSDEGKCEEQCHCHEGFDKKMRCLVGGCQKPYVCKHCLTPEQKKKIDSWNISSHSEKPNNSSLEWEKKETIKQLCIEGLLTDGGHHKQWYLEQILNELGGNTGQHEEWESGIAP